MKKIIMLISVFLIGLFVLAGCSAANDSDVASQNLSYEADNFGVDRRIVFFNGITDTYLLEIEGRCAITDQGNQLEVMCKVADKQFKKHFLGLSDNVSYFVEQLESTDVSVYRYSVKFKPEIIIPDVEIDIRDVTKK